MPSYQCRKSHQGNIMIDKFMEFPILLRGYLCLETESLLKTESFNNANFVIICTSGYHMLVSWQLSVFSAAFNSSIKIISFLIGNSIGSGKFLLRQWYFPYWFCKNFILKQWNGKVVTLTALSLPEEWLSNWWPSMPSVMTRQCDISSYPLFTDGTEDCLIDIFQYLQW